MYIYIDRFGQQDFTYFQNFRRTFKCTEYSRFLELRKPAMPQGLFSLSLLLVLSPASKTCGINVLFWGRGRQKQRFLQCLLYCIRFAATCHSTMAKHSKIDCNVRCSC